MRLSGRPRLTTLSGGIYIRPDHIKQRLGGFIAHGEKKRDKNEGRFEKEWENFQDEPDLHRGCEMEEEKCVFDLEAGAAVASQILFEGHVTRGDGGDGGPDWGPAT